MERLHEFVLKDGRTIVAADARVSGDSGKLSDYNPEQLSEFHIHFIRIIPQGTKWEDCSKRVGWTGPDYDPDPVIEYTWPVGTITFPVHAISSYRRVSEDNPQGITVIKTLSLEPSHALLFPTRINAILVSRYWRKQGLVVHREGRQVWVVRKAP